MAQKRFVNDMALGKQICDVLGVDVDMGTVYSLTLCCDIDCVPVLTLDMFVPGQDNADKITRVLKEYHLVEVKELKE